MKEDVAHQRTLARAADARYHRHHVQGEAYVDALQVVFAGTFYLDIVVPRAVMRGHGDGFLAQQVAHRIAVAMLLQVLRVALVHHFAAKASGFGADVDDVVGGADDFFVVLYDDYRVAQLLELAQDADELVRVAAMEADAGFVQYVEATYEAAAQRGGQVDALAFAAGQGVAQTVQCQIAQAHVDEESDAAVYLRQDAARHLRLVFGQLQAVEECLKVGDGQVHQLRDVASAHPHVARFGLQAAAVAARTEGLAAVAGQHHAVLYLVLVLLQHAEEGVDAFEVGRTLPQHAALLVGQLVVGGKDGEARLFGAADDHVAPFAHLLAPPAHHGSVVDGQGAVGHHQMLVDADDAAEAFAFGASAHGRVEREHLVVGLLEADAVGLELGAEAVEAGGAVGLVEAQQAGAVALVHGCLHGVGQSADGVFLR